MITGAPPTRCAHPAKLRPLTGLTPYMAPLDHLQPTKVHVSQVEINFNLYKGSL